MNEQEHHTQRMERLRQEQARKIRMHQGQNKYARKGQIVMAGSSLMEGFPVTEMVLPYNLPLIVYNRGIAGDTTDGQLARMDSTFWDLQPSRVFINIGTNDISAPDYTREKLLSNYRKILTQLKERLPQAKVWLLAYYPVNRGPQFRTEHFRARTNAELEAVNQELEKLAAEFAYGFIDVFHPLLDQEGNLPAEVTMDGMHMYPEGYKPVLDILLPYLR